MRKKEILEKNIFSKETIGDIYLKMKLHFDLSEKKNIYI